MGPFGAAYGWGEGVEEGGKKTLPKICRTYPAMILPREDPKNINHVTHLLISADRSNFSPEDRKSLFGCLS